MYVRYILLFYICVNLAWGRLFEIASRVIGGELTEKNQFPHSVRLAVVTLEDFEYTCGGSLITPLWVLTTGFCVVRKKHIDVLLGANALGEGMTIRSKTFFHHPKFRDDNFNFDLGLIQLYSEPCDPAIKPVRLLSKMQARKHWDNKLVVIPGWGYEKDATKVSDVQRYVTMRVISNRLCATHYEPNFITPHTLCAVGEGNYTHTTCHGDSGNGLVILDTDGKFTQIAVASFVSSASCYESPAGFVKLGQHLDWIQQETGLQILN